MTITAYKKHFFETLEGEYPKEEVGSFFYILLKDILGLTRLEIALHPEKQLPEDDREKLEAALKRLEQHEPIQYITGNTEFYGLPFNVDNNVLIPRPETEELVQWILDDYDPSAKLNILDIGTGSGCIAVALAINLPESKVTAVDISPGALYTARQNAALNKVPVEFLQLDVLSTEQLWMDFDVIVSNPPYVRELEKKQMQRNVLDHEPKNALFVKDEDPLLFYRKIAGLASKSLKPGGMLYFEINQYLGMETEALLAEKNFQTSLKKDIFGVHRMLRGIKL